MHNPLHTIALAQVTDPQTIQTSPVNSGAIDCQGFESLAVAVLVGNIADTLSGSVRIDVKIEHAEDDGTGAPASFTACEDADVLNFAGLSSGVFLSIDAAGKKQKRHVVGYRGGKRFVKVTATPVSLATGGGIAMLAMKGQPAQAPVANG